MPEFAIGVDLGGTNLRIAAVDEEGRLLEKVSKDTEVARGRDYVISEMCDAIRELSAKFVKTHTLRGAGIGVPGIIDKRTGMLRQSPNLPGWHDYPVRDEIERRLGTPVILENDANAAALGESWLGAARGLDDMCMVTLGTGVGGGLVLRQRIWHGMTGMANEFGHMTVDPDGPLCKCGNSGCVEMFASATAVVRMAREAVASGRAPGLAGVASEAGFSAQAVYDLAVQGDPAAREVFQRVGWALGILMADLVNALNLHMYVIGGGVSGAWDMFAPSLFAETLRRSMVYKATAPEDPGKQEVAPRGRPTIITRALLGGEAGLYGAARLPMVASEERQRRPRGKKKRA